MLELELFELIKEYKTSDEYEKKRIEEKLTNLYLEHSNEVEEFILKNSINLDKSSNELFLKIKELALNKEDINKNELDKNYDTNSNNNNNKQNDVNSDIVFIKNSFIKWEEEFTKNQNQINSICIEIIEKIINKYIHSNFELLSQILGIKDSENYELFKNMLRNKIREFYALKIQNYYQSENFKELGFFKKRQKKSEILKFIEKIGRYEFDNKKIEEIIK